MGRQRKREQRRRDKSPSSGAAFAVEYSGGFDRVDYENIAGLVEETIHDAAAALLNDIPPTPDPHNPLGGSITSILAREGHRSGDEYRDRVEGWRREALEAVPAATREFLRYERARGEFLIRNESDRYLESIRVVVQFPADVQVLAAGDSDYCDHDGGFDVLRVLPKRPPTYAKQYAFDLDGLAMPRYSTPAVPGFRIQFDVDDAEAGPRVTWHVGDLRPRASVVGDDRFAIVTANHIESLTVAWWVTAKGIDHVFEGAATIACAQEKGVHARWERRSA